MALALLSKDISLLPMNFNLEFFKTEAITKRGKERGHSYFNQVYIHHISFGEGSRKSPFRPDVSDQ